MHIRMKRGDEEIGGFSLRELCRALAYGEVEDGKDLAWHEGLGEWIKPTEIDGVTRRMTSQVYWLLADYLEEMHPLESLEAEGGVKEGPGNVFASLFLGPIAKSIGTRYYLFGITTNRIVLLPGSAGEAEEILLGRIKSYSLSERLFGEREASALRLL